jgi:UPF0755 protein
MRFVWQKLNLFFKIILVAFVVMAIYVGNVVFFPQKIPNGQYQIIVNKHQNLFELATVLERENIIKDRRVFLILLRALNKDTKVAAGLYFLKNPISIWGLIARLTNGRPDQISITLIDGWFFEQIRDYINGIPEIKHITSGMTEAELKAALKIETPNLEGLFYPSTYFIAPGQTDLEIYQHAYKIMQDKLAAIYATRSQSTDYTSPYQLLIMASLIERETANVKDMYLVSTVFNNRIRAKMKLQDDPSVFYGLRKNSSKVVRSRFQYDTPYNTYLHYGLPPTPICTPSLNALNAAAHPEDKPKLYFFVAVGSGKTKFSATYNEHLTAVNRYLKKTPQVPTPKPKENVPMKKNQSKRDNNE